VALTGHRTERLKHVQMIKMIFRVRMNLELWSARHRAYDREQWREIVETATLLQKHAIQNDDDDDDEFGDSPVLCFQTKATALFEGRLLSFW